jgi:hypothetical protein
MKLNKNSKELILFFTKNRHINKVTQTKQTENILVDIYNDICEAYHYSKKLRKEHFNITTKKISNVSQIKRPKFFTSNSFPEEVRNHIDNKVVNEITYQFSIFERNIKIHFMVEDENIENKMSIYNTYVNRMVMWLYILNQYASKECSNTLDVFLYFTSLKKKLPGSNIEILNQIHVNTAFTTTCPRDSEIVVFRKEEWFRAFVHETMHNFGLDFSNMNNTDVNTCILNIFKVKSDVNLYESYTEFWAEIINALFCSFFMLKDKTNVDDFLTNSIFFINFERTFSFFQLVKTLNFMGLQYSDLYSDTEQSRVLRENLYKEKTNVLAYYIIKNVLIDNYQGFLNWCKKNNLSILQFKKTKTNQIEFCRFIEKNYKTKSVLNGVKETQHFLHNINTTNKKKEKNMDFILSNLRMSICELG